MTFIRINNIIINSERVLYLLQEQGNINRVTLMFDTGVKFDFLGSEAAELWRHFDSEKTWQDEP